MSLVNGLFFGWIPDVNKKLDTKQVTFKIPLELLVLTRKILCKRYVYDIGNRQGYHVDWINQDKYNTEIKITDTPDLTEVPTSLPCDELYKSKIQVSYGLRKLVTISVYYTTGTVLVQGVKCRRWLREMFDTLIHVIRTIYAFVGSQRYPGFQDAVRDCLSTHPVPNVTTLPSGKVDVHDFPTNNTLTRPSLAKLIQLATLQHHADKFTAVVSTSDTFPSPQQSGSDQPSDSPLPDTLSSSVLSGSKHPSASPMPSTPSSPAMQQKTPASSITQLVSRSPTTPRTKS